MIFYYMRREGCLEPIHDNLEAMGGHDTTQKFIFSTFFLLFLLKTVPRAKGVLNEALKFFKTS